MLPRRHILDVWELIKNTEDLKSMATVTLAIDAIKYMHNEPKKDHLVEALELNEFICFMFPAKRPKNRSLLYHVVSDLVGLLMYGMPNTRKLAIDNIETINYSEKNMEIYPVIEVWNMLKTRIKRKRNEANDIIDGFIRKIRVEMDILERFPFVEDIFAESKDRIKEWLPSFASYYDENRKNVRGTYDKWWATWLCKTSKEEVLGAMVNRLASQVEREYDIVIDKDKIFSSIISDRAANRVENEQFTRWYKEGVNLLLKI
ncbi:MAG: hypothetical protein PHT96_05860 [Syntrophorhabdaceae bacterium]|nr:hypothetical protein [Syntrophorhabdaceae bacterium]MDD4195923.1 hypothetical protein [Syntrophorhabdaceae bacterium]